MSAGWVAVITALIAGACAVLGQAILAKSNNQKLTQDLFARIDKQSELNDEKLKGDIAVIKTEIKTLSDRVEKHNNLIERMYEVEGAVRELQHNQQRGAN